MGLHLVVNLHGSINSNAPVRKALNELWVARKFSASVVTDDGPTVGMLRLCKDYVAWCPTDEGLLSDLLKKRGMVSASRGLDQEALKGLGFKNHGDLAAKMREKYGPIYVTGVIPANTYPGQNKEVSIAVVWNILVCNESLAENLVYDITKTLLEHRNELVAVHKDASYITLQNQASGGSPIPFHAGALRYFKEKGLKIK